jgi:hypothetical protein
MSGERDLNNAISVASTIAPAAAATATTTGAGVDLAGYRSAAVVLHCGVFTDGTFTPTVEESDDDSSYSTVAAGDLSGAFTAVTASTDLSVQEVGYLGSKRYIRLLMTETVASAGALFSAVVVRGNPITKPA